MRWFCWFKTVSYKNHALFAGLKLLFLKSMRWFCWFKTVFYKILMDAAGC
jgi:hypothetical protein